MSVRCLKSPCFAEQGVPITMQTDTDDAQLRGQVGHSNLTCADMTIVFYHGAVHKWSCALAIASYILQKHITARVFARQLHPCIHMYAASRYDTCSVSTAYMAYYTLQDQYMMATMHGWRSH